MNTKETRVLMKAMTRDGWQNVTATRDPLGVFGAADEVQATWPSGRRQGQVFSFLSAEDYWQWRTRRKEQIKQ